MTLLVLAVGVIGILLTCAVAVLAARVIPDAARSAGDAWWRLTAGGPLSLEEEIRHAYARGEIDAVEFEVRLSRLVERVAERDGERFDPFGPLVLAGRWRFSADGRLVERGPRWGDTDRPPARRRRRRDRVLAIHRSCDEALAALDDVPTAPARQSGWPEHSTAPRNARARPGW